MLMTCTVWLTRLTKIKQLIYTSMCHSLKTVHHFLLVSFGCDVIGILNTAVTFQCVSYIICWLLINSRCLKNNGNILKITLALLSSFVIIVYNFSSSCLSLYYRPKVDCLGKRDTSGMLCITSLTSNCWKKKKKHCNLTPKLKISLTVSYF